ncbi:MAG TPA: DinB family protein [Thermoanaerobaculia bacterium]
MNPEKHAELKMLRTLLICLLAPAGIALAQDNPLSGYTKSFYGEMKAVLLASAEKVPEVSYNFKPTETVRSFGQVVGHVADAQYLLCSIVLAEKNPALNIEQSKTSKADLIGALKAAFAYCDRAYDGMTDASAARAVKLFGGDSSRLGVLTVNNMHLAEHYGNLVVYMRLKHIVPPTSEPGSRVIALGAIVAPLKPKRLHA